MLKWINVSEGWGNGRRSIYVELIAARNLHFPVKAKYCIDDNSLRNNILIHVEVFVPVND